MKKKFISLLLTVAALAALAIPASAATVSNQTVVEFNYLSTQKIDENTDCYKITIPAKINLDSTKEGKDGGMGFSGTGTVAFSGTIGQESHVDVYVASANGYYLKSESGATSAAYTMTPGFTTDVVKLNADKFSNSYEAGDAIGMCTCNSKAFANGEEITLTFANDGETGIYGKCDLADTLTFTYTYDDSTAVSVNVIGGGTDVYTGTVDQESHDAN